MPDKVTVTNGPGTYDLVDVAISPYARPAGISSTSAFAENSNQQPGGSITITFGQLVDYVSVKIFSSNRSGNSITAFNSEGKEIQRKYFEFGYTFLGLNFGNPESIVELGTPGTGIQKVVININDGDYVYFDDLMIKRLQVIAEPPPEEAPDIEYTIPLELIIIKKPGDASYTIPIKYDIRPAIPSFPEFIIINETQITVNPIPIEYWRVMELLSRELLGTKVADFFDDERELKTVLNFGNDFQILLTNWQWSEERSEGEFLVKLYEPLPTNIDRKTQVWISREVSPTLIDAINLTIIPSPIPFLFLRPANVNLNLLGLSGFDIANVALEQLIPSGSVVTSSDGVVLSSPLLERYYHDDFRSAELNVDYTNYREFVHFSSAATRLTVFKRKLENLEILNTEIAAQNTAASASVSASGGDITLASSYQHLESLNEEKQELIRSFDGYERFLYYESGSFSGSLSGLEEDPIVVISDVSWPKSNGTVLPTTSSTAETYYETQLSYAEEYDRLNPSWLLNNIPEYLLADDDSTDYHTFLNMIGHHFDRVKLYVDHMTDLYDRGPNPDEGLSKDMLWTVAESLGIDLPNQYTIQSIVDYALGRATVTQETYRKAVAETWKRFLHNQLFVSKTKGTKTSLETLRNIYGVLPEFVRVRESVIPSTALDELAFETFDELTNVLTTNNTSSLSVPFALSGQFSPYTIELRFAATPTSGAFKDSIIMHGGNDWAVLLHPTGVYQGHRGYLEFVAGGDTLAQATVDPYYDGGYYTLMIRQNDGPIDFVVKQYEDGNFTYQYSAEVTHSITGTFSQSNYITLGASESVTFDGITGSVSIKHDEFRLWSEVLTDATYNRHVKFPGMYGGNTTGSAATNLVYRQSFNKPQNLATTSLLPNESPLQVVTASIASGFSGSAVFPYQLLKVGRETERLVANIGTQYSTNKIVVEDEPIFKPEFVQKTGSFTITELSRTHSVRALATGSSSVSGIEELDAEQSSNKVGFYMSLAESINDNIYRSLGKVDVADLIGDPRNVYRDYYPDLQDLYQFYNDTYRPTYDYNKFVRFVEGILDGLFLQAKQNVPALANLITGIVIEPTILERNKQTITREAPKVSGEGTRREQQARQILQDEGSYPDARNADARIEISGTFGVAGDTTDLEAIFEDIGEDVALANYFSYEGLINQPDVLETLGAPFFYEGELDAFVAEEDILAEYNTFFGLIGATDFTGSIDAEAPIYDAIFDLNIIETNLSASAEREFLAPYIEPASTFTNPAATTFFILSTGSFGVPFYVKEKRYREKNLRDRGTWVRGTVYQKNDVVTQLAESGSGAIRAGNGRQFRCLTDNIVDAGNALRPFVSQIEPVLDRKNWAPVELIPEIKFRLYRAIVSGSSHIGSGSLAIVPWAGNENKAVFIGYSQYHYRFYRPTDTPWIRSRYRGCKQTSNTTLDGKEPVEIFPSSEAQLFVREGTPVKPDSDEGGPILDVR